MKTAKMIRDLSGPDWSGTVYLYQLSEPIEYTRFEEVDDDYVELELAAEFVISSGTNVMFSGPETLIFPADEDGEVTSWCEIGGSRGYIDPDRAIREAGYEVI